MCRPISIRRLFRVYFHSRLAFFWFCRNQQVQADVRAARDILRDPLFKTSMFKKYRCWSTDGFDVRTGKDVRPRVWPQPGNADLYTTADVRHHLVLVYGRLRTVLDRMATC